MKRNDLIHIESVEIDFVHIQAFHFFLNTIWEDVKIEDICTVSNDHFRVDLAMPMSVESRLIMYLWEDWTSKLMHNMYAVLN